MVNDAMATGWATGAAGWIRNERIFDHVFTPVTAAILAAADLAHATRVLDVGCGTGTLLAAAVDAGAQAVGVDISQPMADAARSRVPAATVVVADAQTADLLALAPGDPFDRVTSRFGVMFFADPVAAFANIRAATAPGARLTFAAWREGESDVFTVGNEVFLERLTAPPTVAQPDVPGPMGLASGDRIGQVLGDAGWQAVTLTELEPELDYGVDGTDGVDARMAVAQSGSVARAARAELEPRLGPDGWDDLVGRARERLVDRAAATGSVRMTGHVWLVTAVNPAGSPA